MENLILEYLSKKYKMRPISAFRNKEIFLYFFAVENDDFKSLKFEEKQCKIYML